MYVERYRRLRDLREDHDLTQAQVGDAINITQRAYSYYESGQHIIPPEVLLRLADLYGVSVDYLLGRDETPAAQPPRGGSGRLQLAALRREHGMTQAQAAAMLGCSASLYARYERGERPLPLPLAVKLADLYGVPLDRLAGRE